MYIDKSKIGQLSQDKTLNKTVTNLNSDVMVNLVALCETMKSHLEGCIIEKTTNWLLQENLWLKNENNQLGTSFYNYCRGDIILSVDLGTNNIGTEIRYPHPCVVLYDNDEDWLIVAPITAAQLDVNREPIVHLPFEVLARKQVRQPPTGEFMFIKHSVIQVDQIQRISKHKIVNKMRLKLRTDLLNQIDNVLIENYAPLKATLIKTMIDINKQQSVGLKLKDEEISKLKEEISVKELSVDQLQKQLKENAMTNKELMILVENLEKKIRDQYKIS